MLRWITALIVGIICSILVMGLLASGLIERSGDFGGDLLLSKFFVITGGFLFLGEGATSLEKFVGASLYYFVFFTIIGFAIGYFVEWLIKHVRE